MIELSVADLFTEDELDRAGELHAECQPEDFVARCVRDIVTPALPRIDGETGEANDAAELARAIQRTISAIAGPGGIVHGLQ